MCSYLQEGAGLSLPTVSFLLHGMGNRAGHTGVLLGNDPKGKQKFAARIVVKESGHIPFYIFSSSPFFSVAFISLMNVISSAECEDLKQQHTAP